MRFYRHCTADFKCVCKANINNKPITFRSSSPFWRGHSWACANSFASWQNPLAHLCMYRGFSCMCKKQGLFQTSVFLVFARAWESPHVRRWAGTLHMCRCAAGLSWELSPLAHLCTYRENLPGREK